MPRPWLLGLTFFLTIHSAPYECQVRESAAWNTDMIICWPVDGVTDHSQGVLRFWRENPKGLVGEVPCKGEEEQP